MKYAKRSITPSALLLCFSLLLLWAASVNAQRVFLLGDFGFGDAAHPPENRV